jgi:phosphatidylserine decarboxylase
MDLSWIWSFAIFTITLSITALFFFWFNRDPDRHPPTRNNNNNNNNIIVSPADGTVIYVEHFEVGSLPVPKKFGKEIHLEKFDSLKSFDSGGHIIGIYLSPLNVHVTRSPISGDILFTGYCSGAFFSKKLLGFKTVDEMTMCIIQGNGIIAGVVQMAAYIARRAVLYVRSDEHVNIGERIGKIRLGSQVDLILPCKTALSIIAKPGSKVRAGESIIATF